MHRESKICKYCKHVIKFQTTTRKAFINDICDDCYNEITQDYVNDTMGK